MAQFKYTPEHIQFLTENFKKVSVYTLSELFEKEFGIYKKPQTISSALKARGIKCGRAQGELTRGQPRIFTPEQMQWFKDNYPNMSRREITAAFNKHYNENREEKQIVAFLKNNKIHSGRGGYFTKGMTSWNKGKKGTTGSNSGSFKKGHKPHSHLPVGTQRETKDGYIEIKVAEPKTWKSKQRIIWEQHHGAIPENHKVRFKDGNKHNFNINNLFIVNASEHQILNSLKFKQQPLEVRETTILLARISSKTIELSNREKA